MRLKILLAAATAVAITGCNGSTSPDGTSQPTGQSPNIPDKDLENQVMTALSDAPKNGLTKDLFLKGALPADPVQRRQQLLNAITSYASALANGKVDPNKIRDVYTVPRSRVDISAGLAQALSQHKLRDWLATLAPQTAEYRALSNAFVQLVQHSPDLPTSSIPAGNAIRPGTSDPRIPAIVQTLQELGYLSPQQQVQQQQPQFALVQPRQNKRHKGRAASGPRYTAPIVQAVQRFQTDVGAKPNGIIGSDTIEALNQGPRDRARTLAVAMERLRWLDRNPPATRIDVNTAAAVLDYWRDGQDQGERVVVDGQPGWETPQIGAPIFQLVANPSWNVPKSIVDEEISKKSGSWLRQNNFVQKNGRWVQLPGPKNSLGQVKFDMKDDQAIYLHDTPAKQLFQLTDRHRSHGCVRVQNAIDFAHTLAQADGIDDEFSQAMASGNETFVALHHPIPVRLMYHTAYLGGDGKVHFAADVYGWDDDVAAALGYAIQPRAAQAQQTADVGP